MNYFKDESLNQSTNPLLANIGQPKPRPQPISQGQSMLPTANNSIYKDPSLAGQIANGNMYGKMAQDKALLAQQVGNKLSSQPAPQQVPQQVPQPVPQSIPEQAPKPTPVLGSIGGPGQDRVYSELGTAPTYGENQPPTNLYGGEQTSLNLGGEMSQITPEQAQLKITSPNEQDQNEVMAFPEQYGSFITPNDPTTAPIFQQTDQFKLVDGTDGGNLPISEDNGSVYQCPFTQTPCSRPSFFKRIGAFFKKLLGIYDDNQAFAICQNENLKDPIARQVLISTGQFDNEVRTQLADLEAQPPGSNGFDGGAGKIPLPDAGALPNSAPPSTGYLGKPVNLQGGGQ